MIPSINPFPSILIPPICLIPFPKNPSNESISDSLARMVCSIINIHKLNPINHQELLISPPLNIIIIIIMKFLALISGGKDSIFNIIKCLEQGHQLVAVGNMYHSQQGLEKDSYMYQTVGTNVTQAIAEALGVPIYRKEIKGEPKITSLEYQGEKGEESKGDEVEDLYQLIQEVIANHPQIQGVSSGAIMSTYQKLRVENICNRLKLTSLAYLWQLDQTQLLDDMIQGGMDSILIKVASYGLNEKHLNRTIKDLQPYFQKMKGECQMNVCGEGGEYQSLTLDCPIYKKRIVIEDYQIVKHDQNIYAPVVYMKINKVSLAQK